MALVIDSKHHIELDGVKYRLAESAEGQHHNVRGEPLRPPNAVTVQGEANQKFQPRPDVLVWSWTDWSEGEGLRVFDFQDSKRSHKLTGCRVFDEPGILQPGYFVEYAPNPSGGKITESAVFAVAMGKLWALNKAAAQYWEWNESSDNWKWPLSFTGPGGGAEAATGDNDNLYWVGNGTASVWKWPGTGSAAAISSATVDATDPRFIAHAGPYVYVYSPSAAKVWEIAKAGGSTTEIDSWTESSKSPDGKSGIAVLNGKVYVMITNEAATVIREIVPTTAAAAGFGAEIARINGFEGEAIWSHSGSLFLFGKSDDPNTIRTILYLAPQGEYGSLGRLRVGDDLKEVLSLGGGMLNHFFITRNGSDGVTKSHLWEFDSITGGIACVGIDEVPDMSDEIIGAGAVFKGEPFWGPSETGYTSRAFMRTDKNKYTKSSSAESPINDFGLATKKNLDKLILTMEALPADWQVRVDYQIDSSGTWVNVIDTSTTGDTEVSAAVSTDTSTVTFNTLSLRIRMDYTGGGDPTTGPRITSVESRASVATKVKVFQYLVDLSTDQSGGFQSREGASKVDSFLATAVKDTVVDLKDGYTSPRAGEFDQYDVVIDEYNVILDRPGEGFAALSLREVV